MQEPEQRAACPLALLCVPTLLFLLSPQRLPQAQTPPLPSPFVLKLISGAEVGQGQRKMLMVQDETLSLGHNSSFLPDITNYPPQA